MDYIQSNVTRWLTKGRVYVNHPAEVPSHRRAQRGPNGGLYYETADGTPEGEIGDYSTDTTTPDSQGAVSRAIDAVSSLFSRDTDTSLEDLDGFPDDVTLDSAPTRRDLMGRTDLAGDPTPVTPSTDPTRPSSQSVWETLGHGAEADDEQTGVSRDRVDEILSPDAESAETGADTDTPSTPSRPTTVTTDGTEVPVTTGRRVTAMAKTSTELAAIDMVLSNLRTWFETEYDLPEAMVHQAVFAVRRHLFHTVE